MTIPAEPKIKFRVNKGNPPNANHHPYSSHPSSVSSYKERRTMARFGMLLLVTTAAPLHALRPFFFQVRSTRLQYGKGTDIWPPTNEAPVHLADSFPNSQLPADVVAATNALQSGAAAKSDQDTRRKQQLLKRLIPRILRRAATAEEQTRRPAIDRTPLLVALAMLPFFVQPMDVLIVTFLSGYTYLLTQLARSSAPPPTVPALPPQGHVPLWCNNPLGYKLTSSVEYDRWLKLGVLTGLIAPLLWIGRHSLWTTTAVPFASVALAGRPLFLLCCQALSESVTRYYPSVPLPVRILVPVSYNTVRLVYLWKWACTTTAPLGTVGRSLAVANLAYWSLNLFAFLLPIAVIKYMRAHFFAVEAEQVTLRPGMEETVGLSSSATTTTTSTFYFNR